MASDEPRVIHKRLTTYRKYACCPKCPPFQEFEFKLKFTGKGYTDAMNPMKYIHSCDSCGEEFHLSEIYPHLEYIEAEDPV